MATHSYFIPAVPPTELKTSLLTKGEESSVT